jgi:hypothetical protein
MRSFELGVEESVRVELFVLEQDGLRCAASEVDTRVPFDSGLAGLRSGRTVFETGALPKAPGDSGRTNAAEPAALRIETPSFRRKPESIFAHAGASSLLVIPAQAGIHLDPDANAGASGIAGLAPGSDGRLPAVAGNR